MRAFCLDWNSVTALKGIRTLSYWRVRRRRVDRVINVYVGRIFIFYVFFEWTLNIIDLKGSQNQSIQIRKSHLFLS